MTGNEAKQVKISNRIRWQSLDDTVPPAFGRVTFIGFNGFEVEWDDGEFSNWKFADAHQLCCVHLVKS